MLGLCCNFLDSSGNNLLVTKTLKLSNLKQYSTSHIKSTYLTNLKSISDTLPVILESGIKFLRISSTLFPLWDKVDPETYNNDETEALLISIGKFILKHQMRLNTHPAQFFNLSSDSEEVIQSSIKELEFHAAIFDRMGLPRTTYYNINIHGGKGNRMSTLRQNINKLNDSARSRLTLENDEFSYSVNQLVDAGVPIVFDSHHFSLNLNDMSSEAALELAINSWGNIKPTTHLSNSRPEHIRSSSKSKLRIHSDFISYVHPELIKYKDLVDIEIEAKMKNLAFHKVKEELL